MGDLWPSGPFGQEQAIERMRQLLTTLVGEQVAREMMDCMGVKGFVQRVLPDDAAEELRASAEKGRSTNLATFYSIEFPSISTRRNQPGRLVRIQEKW